MTQFGTQEAKSQPHPDQEALSSFLNSLRESGAINMFASPGYLQDAFGISKSEARQAFKYWADNFSS